MFFGCSLALVLHASQLDYDFLVSTRVTLSRCLMLAGVREVSSFGALGTEHFALDDLLR